MLVVMERPGDLNAPFRTRTCYAAARWKHGYETHRGWLRGRIVNKRRPWSGKKGMHGFISKKCVCSGPGSGSPGWLGWRVITEAEGKLTMPPQGQPNLDRLALFSEASLWV